MVKLGVSSVYGLEDPRSGAIRYIGQTAQKPEQRLYQHISRAKQGPKQNHLFSWIRQLTVLNLEPTVVVLEETTNELITGREKYWINYLIANGADLTNTNLDPHKPHNIGVPMSEEQKGKQATKETRKKLSEARKGMRPTEETKRKMSESQRKRRFYERG